MLRIAAKTMHLTAKVYELESSHAHFQPLYTFIPSPLLYRYTTVCLSSVCLSVTLHIVVEAITTTTTSIIGLVLSRHWKEPEMTASTMMVATAVQTMTIVTTKSLAMMAELMTTVGQSQRQQRP